MKTMVRFVCVAMLLLIPRLAPAATTINGTTWFPVGPAPTTGGQAYGSPSVIDVVGRAGPIAINPLNPQVIYIGAANGGVWETSDSGQSWRPRSDDQASLAIGAILLDNCTVNDCKTIYAGTGENAIRRDTYRGAGLLIGTTSGNEFPTFSWSLNGAAIFGNGSINNIVLDPSHRLFVTLSSGETASASESTVTAPAPSQGYGIFRSPDAMGSSWKKLNVAGSNNAKPTSLVLDPQDGNTLYAGFMGRGIFKSTDGGDNWCPLNPGINVAGCPAGSPNLLNPASTFDFVELDIQHPSAAKPAVLYATLGVCGDPITADCVPGIYRSVDGGATWEQRRAPVPNSTGITAGICPRNYSRYSHLLKIDPGNSDHVYLGGYGLCRSDDGGMTFVSMLGGNHPDQHGMAFHPTDPQHLYLANDGGVYDSPDGGTNWFSLNDDLQITEFYSISSSPLTARVTGGTQDNGTMLWVGSRVWQHIDTGDSASTVMDLSDVNRIFDLYSRQCPQSGGPNFTQFNEILTGLGGVTHSECYDSFTGYPEDSAYYPPITQDPQSPFPLYTGTVKVYQRPPSGPDWTVVSPNLSGGGGPFPDIGTGNVITAIAVSRTDHNIIYAGLYNGDIWRVKAGQTPCPNLSCWSKVNSSTPAAPVSRIAIHPTTPDTVYATFSGFTAGTHVWKTGNGGGSWTPAGSGIPDGQPVNTITIEANDPQRLWVGTDAGVYKSTSGANGFSAFNDGMPNVAVYEISLDETRGRAWAGTHGRGAFVLTKPMVANFEGWVDAGIWDIPVYGTGFLSNQTCTMTILRQDGTPCATGSVDGDGGTIKTDDMGTLTTSKGASYNKKPVAWGCLNGKCVDNTNIASCNQAGNPITTVIVNCGGSIGIEHVNGCQQQNNPPGSVMGLDGTPTPGGAGAGGAPLGAPAIPPGSNPPAPPPGAQQRAFYVTPSVQAGDGSTRALCSVRVPFTVGEERARIIERARDLINASPTCTGAGVTASATGIFPTDVVGHEDRPAYDPHLMISAPSVRGSQLMPAFQSDPGNAGGLCFDLAGLGVPTSGQLEITRVRFATPPGGAAGGGLRFTEVSGLGTCEIDVPTTPGQTATQIAAAVAKAFNTPGLPGPFRRCPAGHNPRDVVQEGDSVLTVLPHTLRLCIGDPKLGITVIPDELKKRYPVANSGPDREVHSTTVVLDGSHSTDPDSTPGTADGIVEYLWFEPLPNGSLVPLGAGPTLTTHLTKGFHHIILKVTNKGGFSDTATTLIEVEKGGEGLEGLSASVFLSEAYARSDGGVVFGVPRNGTTDYRTFALRLRWELSASDKMVAQIRHERLGLDPRPDLRSDIDLDWVFYEHRFGSGLDLRAGREPIPVGIWNDLREVGTSLPFFKPPAAVYQEGGAINETVDGVAASLPVKLGGGGFKLDLAGYAGGWDKLEQVPGEDLAARARAESGFGVRAWLVTPVPGLRFGAAASRFSVRDGLLRVGTSDSWRTALLSIDGSFKAWDVRAEYLAARHPLMLNAIPFPTVDTKGGYVELGGRLSSKLWLHLQASFLDSDLKRPAQPTINAHLDRDLALALDYAFRKNLILKLEGHRDRGYLSQGQNLNPLTDPAVTIRYGILTLAVSF